MIFYVETLELGELFKAKLAKRYTTTGVLPACPCKIL